MAAFVGIYSDATTLVTGDTNGRFDAFAHDRDPDRNGIFDEGNGITIRVSVRSSGVQASHHSFLTAVSDDGRYAAFTSLADKLVSGDTNMKSDVFLRDLQLGTTTRVSVSSSGAQMLDGNVVTLSTSGNGRFVVFGSDAPNLVQARLPRRLVACGALPAHIRRTPR